MRRFFAAAVLVAIVLSSTPATAGSWMFRRSYYSHVPVTPVRIGPIHAGGPAFSRPQGAYVNSGYRVYRGTIAVGGRVYDSFNVYESWVQTGGQY